MARVDLTVPAGVAAGDPLEFEHDGTLYNAAVPDGLGEGDVFQIEVSAAHPAGSFTDYLESRAASGDLMDRFVAWFDSHGIEEQFETFLAEHAHLVKGAAGGSVEHSHEWWPVYQAYQAKFDALLQEFLSETGASADDFLTAAKSASGMNDIILKIFLRLSAVHNRSSSTPRAAPPKLGPRACSGRTLARMGSSALAARESPARSAPSHCLERATGASRPRAPPTALARARGRGRGSNLHHRNSGALPSMRRSSTSWLTSSTAPRSDLVPL